MLNWPKGRSGGLLVSSIIDAVYPENCLLCGTPSHQVSWCEVGPPTTGLRPWDRPHLCRDCRDRMAAGGPVRWASGPGTGRDVPHLAACRTTGGLTALVGAWKYHGVRGVAWPLAELLAAALAGARDAGVDPGILVPVPLHRRRHRQRGFNQAAVLARLAGQALGVPVEEKVARRTRPTRQQALLREQGERRANLAGVFAADPPRPGAPHRLTLVDDVVTSGATTGELARVLALAGWQVVLVASLGLAQGQPDDPPATASDGVPVDTPGAPA